MRNVAYYHAYLDDNYNWAQMFVEQMRCFEKSGFFGNLDSINITAITQRDRRLDVLQELCRLYPARFTIMVVDNIHNNDTEMMDSWSSIFDNKPAISETVTLSRIYRESHTGDFNILYFHMKGITSTLNNLVVPGRTSKYKNRYDWRQFMNTIITDWRDCVNALEHNDVVGVDFQNEPSKHFKGNFFWTKSSHVRQLPNPETMEWWDECKSKMNNDWMNRVSDRFRDEQWVCYKDDVRVFNLKSNDGYYNGNDI